MVCWGSFNTGSSLPREMVCVPHCVFCRVSNHGSGSLTYDLVPVSFQLFKREWEKTKLFANRLIVLSASYCIIVIKIG